LVCWAVLGVFGGGLCWVCLVWGGVLGANLEDVSHG